MKKSEEQIKYNVTALFDIDKRIQTFHLDLLKIVKERKKVYNMTNVTTAEILELIKLEILSE